MLVSSNPVPAKVIPSLVESRFNPYMTEGFSHRYHLGESTFIFGDIRCDFRFLFTFSMNFL